MDSKFQFLVARPLNPHGRRTALEAGADLGEPKIRVHLPPAMSQQRTVPLIGLDPTLVATQATTEGSCAACLIASRSRMCDCQAPGGSNSHAGDIFQPRPDRRHALQADVGHASINAKARARDRSKPSFQRSRRASLRLNLGISELDIRRTAQDAPRLASRLFARSRT